MNKEGRGAKKIFAKNRKSFRYLGCQCYFKVWHPSALQHVILWSIKIIKLTRNSLYSNYNKLQDPRLHLLSCLSSFHHPLLSYLMSASLVYHPKPFFYTHSH